MQNERDESSLFENSFLGKEVQMLPSYLDQSTSAFMSSGSANVDKNIINTNAVNVSGPTATSHTDVTARTLDKGEDEDDGSSARAEQDVDFSERPPADVYYSTTAVDLFPASNINAPHISTYSSLSDWAGGSVKDEEKSQCGGRDSDLSMYEYGSGLNANTDLERFGEREGDFNLFAPESLGSFLDASKFGANSNDAIRFSISPPSNVGRGSVSEYADPFILFVFYRLHTMFAQHMLLSHLHPY